MPGCCDGGREPGGGPPMELAMPLSAAAAAVVGAPESCSRDDACRVEH